MPDIKKAAAKFIFMLKEKFKLTQASLDYTVTEVEALLTLSGAFSFRKLRACRQSYPPPYDELKTEYQQTQVFQDNFGLTVS